MRGFFAPLRMTAKKARARSRFLRDDNQRGNNGSDDNSDSNALRGFESLYGSVSDGDSTSG